MPVFTQNFIDLARRDPQAAAKQAGMSMQQLAGLIEGDQDTDLASCQDHRAGPYDPPGAACSASFLACLDCANARALPHQLPIQLAAIDALEQLRPHLPPGPVGAPTELVDLFKTITLAFLEHPTPRSVTLTSDGDLMSIGTLAFRLRTLRVFAAWMSQQHLPSLHAVTDQQLERYRQHVLRLETSNRHRLDLFVAVRTVWDTERAFPRTADWTPTTPGAARRRPGWPRPLPAGRRGEHDPTRRPSHHGGPAGLEPAHGRGDRRRHRGSARRIGPARGQHPPQPGDPGRVVLPATARSLRRRRGRAGPRPTRTPQQ